MTFILNKFKSLAIGVMAVLFFMGMTLNSCSTQDKGSDTENLEAAAEGEEHPEGEGEEEHPEGEGDEEHPEGDGDEEHPEGDSDEEHPEGEGDEEDKSEK